MADTVNKDVIFSGTRRYVFRITNESDGTGESAVNKLDISTLTGPDGTAPTKVVFEKIDYQVNGFNYVTVLTDHDTDDEIAVLSGSDFVDWTKQGGLVDPASTGGTGDVLVTTDGAINGASYDITLHLRLID